MLVPNGGCYRVVPLYWEQLVSFSDQTGTVQVTTAHHYTYLFCLAGQNLDGSHDNLIVESIRGKPGFLYALQDQPNVTIELPQSQHPRSITEYLSSW